MLLRRHREAREDRQTTSAQVAPEVEAPVEQDAPVIEVEQAEAEQTAPEVVEDETPADADELTDAELEALTAPDADEKPKRNRK